MIDPEHVSATYGRLPGAIEALYPVPPLSWLAPLWSYACGVIASASATGHSALPTSSLAGATRSGNLLLFMLGLLLAGPLLGGAWGASAKIRTHGKPTADAQGSAPQKPLASIPFALPGSASAALVGWLGVVSARWQRAALELRMAPLRLAVSTVFSLVVAAEMGQRTLLITIAALVYAWLRCLVGRPAVAKGPRGEAEGTASQLVDVFLPILLAWLIGHTAFAAIRAESVLVAACFALALGVCPQVHQTGKGLLGMLLPQMLVVVYFTTARQPVAAAGVALLVSSQLLWSDLLKPPGERTKYFRAVQLPLAATMLLSAWTLGHGL